VTQPPDLTALSVAEKDALIVSLLAQLSAAYERIAALEARVGELTQPPKTPDNSSKPLSQGPRCKTACKTFQIPGVNSVQ
jgi:hypothetical protein